MGLVTVLGLLVSACDWAQPRFDAGGTAFSPFESAVDASSFTAQPARWTRPAPIYSDDNRFGPIVVGGRVVIDDSEAIDVRDAKTGKLMWSKTVGCRPTATASGDLLFVLAGSIPSGCYDSFLYALDLVTGAPLWVTTIGGSEPTRPLLANGMVYVADQYVFAVDPATGAIRWTSATFRNCDFSIVYADGVLYDSGNEALDANTGRLLWAVWPYCSATEVTVANGKVFAEWVDGPPNYTFRLHALDAKTGVDVWTAVSHHYSDTAVADGLVYNAMGDDLQALDEATGRLVWSADVTVSLASSPAVAGGVVFFGSRDGSLHAYDASTGRSLWTSPPSEWPMGSPIVADHWVYARDEPDIVCCPNPSRLYAFRLRTTT
jgi:outer membrane protein assembly factor BamB